MEDVDHFTIGSEHWSIGGLGAPIPDDTVKGPAEVVWILRKDVENASADNLSALKHRYTETCIAYCNDCVVLIRGQNNIKVRKRLKEQPKVRTQKVAFHD
jgi:hypothetical protein